MFPFHLVESSWWPMFMMMMGVSITTSIVAFARNLSFSFFLLSFFFITVIFMNWWRDVIRESTFQGYHTSSVEEGIKMGFILFILSEVLFFFSFFWSFFSFSLVSDMNISNNWPPVGVLSLDVFGVPLLNTFILLTSGIMVTWSHHSMLLGNFFLKKLSMVLGVMLGVLFTFLQALEYYNCSFSVADSVFGTTFFVLTGFHGLHVLIGTTFLFIVLIRFFKMHFSNEHHMGFELAAWYWHFVDVVWIFLFFNIYMWGMLYYWF